jgi:hypothetical protein
MMKRALWEGLVAGAAGVAAMTVGEKLEQQVTGRPATRAASQRPDTRGIWQSPTPAWRR